MNLKHCLAWAMVLAAAAVATADAQSLKVRQRMLDQEQELVRDVKAMNTECETNLPVNFDWAGAPEEKLADWSQEAYCDQALSAVSRLCGDKLGKKAVQEKIKSITCGFAPERAISLKDGALQYKMSYPSTDSADFVFKYLETNL